MPARNSETAYSLHTHTAQALVSSGTLTGGVTIYGTNDESDTVGHVIVTFTFTAAANGDRATPVFSQHSWEFVRSECTSISGTSARLRVTVAGA